MIHSVDSALSLAIVSTSFPKQDVLILRNLLTPPPKKKKTPKSKTKENPRDSFYALQKSVHCYDNHIQTVGQVPGWHCLTPLQQTTWPRPINGNHILVPSLIYITCVLKPAHSHSCWLWMWCFHIIAHAVECCFSCKQIQSLAVNEFLLAQASNSPIMPKPPEPGMVHSTETRAHNPCTTTAREGLRGKRRQKGETLKGCKCLHPQSHHSKQICTKRYLFSDKRASKQYFPWLKAGLMWQTFKSSSAGPVLTQEIEK